MKNAKDYQIGTTQEIDIDLIQLNPDFQPRSDAENSDIEELANSIQNDGLFNAITVCVDDEKIYLVAGERRYRASKHNDAKIIRVYFVEKDKALEIALIENLQRENLTAADEAIGLKKLKDKKNLTDEQLGKMIGRARTTVSDILTICNLPEEVLNQARSEKRATKKFLIDLARLGNEKSQKLRYTIAKKKEFKNQEIKNKKVSTSPKDKSIDKMFAIMSGTLTKLTSEQVVNHQSQIDEKIEALVRDWEQMKRNVGHPAIT